MAVIDYGVRTHLVGWFKSSPHSIEQGEFVPNQFMRRKEEFYSMMSILCLLVIGLVSPLDVGSISEAVNNSVKQWLEIRDWGC